MSAQLETKTPQAMIQASDLSPAEVQILRTTIAKDLNDAELALFLRVAQMRGLNPLAGQIHAIKRRDGEDGSKMTMQVSIDGFRLIAHRTGEHAGTDDAIYEEIAGEDHPSKATVTVYRLVQGQRAPYTASARWKEYAPTGKRDFMWRKMPYLMLGKVCEALALRKAFAQELSSLYTPEEMDQAEDYPIEPKVLKPIKTERDFKCSADMRVTLEATCADAVSHGIKRAEIEELLKEYGATGISQLGDGAARKFCDALTSLINLAQEAMVEGRGE